MEQKIESVFLQILSFCIHDTMILDDILIQEEWKD